MGFYCDVRARDGARLAVDDVHNPGGGAQPEADREGRAITVLGLRFI